MEQQENRSDVRGQLFLRVKCDVMTVEEYEKTVRYEAELFSPDYSYSENGPELNGAPESTRLEADVTFIHFIFQMDQKLDHILALLSHDRGVKRPLEAVGMDISGTGIKICVEEPVDVGKIIRLKFFLATVPLTIIDVFAEVIWATPVEKDGRISFHIGLKFMNLSQRNRERIFNFVFKKQRELIRRIRVRDEETQTARLS